MNLKTRELRSKCHKSKKYEPCFICGEHSLIVEHHHTVPLSEVIAYINLLQLSDIPEPPKVCLCPNCHSYIHKLLREPLLFNNFPESFNLERFRRICDLGNQYRESLRGMFQCL